MKHRIIIIMIYMLIPLFSVWALSESVTMNIEAYKREKSTQSTNMTMALTFEDVFADNDSESFIDLTRHIEKYLKESPSTVEVGEWESMRLFMLNIENAPPGIGSCRIHIDFTGFKRTGGKENIPFTCYYDFNATEAYLSNDVGRVSIMSLEYKPSAHAHTERMTYLINSPEEAWNFHTEVGIGIAVSDYRSAEVLGNGTYQANVTITLETR